MEGKKTAETAAAQTLTAAKNDATRDAAKQLERKPKVAVKEQKPKKMVFKKVD
jgi:hypothetical protein